ncbi:MAG: SEC-C metal-binding domain-containing protein [Bacillota bacterium]|nr:SEC-C metal-binding domain-containing protein [Bacillota bacterium]MDW7682677.1 SEC-C metal-binding domain-containing protein [Bacillota bacterium]
MRPDALVKPFLCDREKIVREFAAKYFKVSFNKDDDLISYVLQGCDMYGEKENLLLLVYAKEFTQTETSLYNVLQRMEKATDYNVAFHYGNIIANADPVLLRNVVDNAGESKRILSHWWKRIRRRLDFSLWSTERLWDELLSFCESNKDARLDEIEYSYGNDIVKAIGNRNDAPVEEILRILQDGDKYYRYEENYLTLLAGELRLKAAIPFLFEKLRIDADLLCEKAAESLVKIGTDDVVLQLKDSFLQETSSFQIFTASIFGRIKSAECERALLDIIPKTEDNLIQTILADCFCNLISEKGIPFVRELIYTGYDRSLLSLEESLYAATKVMGIKLDDEDTLFAEMPEHREIEDYPIIDNETKKKNHKIGRNEPCFCGSGKKYKKCCLM